VVDDDDEDDDAAIFRLQITVRVDAVVAPVA
jgi:hypothetical protein